MLKIISILTVIFITFNFAHAEKILIFEFTEKELLELEVRKVRGSDNKTKYTVGSNENGNYLKSVADNACLRSWKRN